VCLAPFLRRRKKPTTIGRDSFSHGAIRFTHLSKSIKGLNIKKKLQAASRNFAVSMAAESPAFPFEFLQTFGATPKDVCM
jgi:hypothetical protein